MLFYFMFYKMFYQSNYIITIQTQFVNMVFSYFYIFHNFKHIFCIFFTINTQKKRKENRSYSFLSVFYYNIFF